MDIVSLLAVIGESSMEEHSQAMTSSWTAILPRIIPAPQALLKPNRPARMPQVNAAVVGVHNGTLFQTLNYFPNIIHPIEELSPFAFRVYKIKHRVEASLPSSEAKPSKPPSISTDAVKMTDLESNESSPPKHRRSTFGNQDKPKPHVPAYIFSPLNALSILSFLLTVGLLIWALLERDGTACVALGTISLASSIVGFASWWSPVLMNRSFKSKVPDGDVVIRTREGAFIVVKCDEDVARELYTGHEECMYYVSRRPYRALVGVGTFLLMISVVLLGNCKWTMQAAIGSSYIVLNGAYWLAALLPKSMYWDLSAYEFVDETPKDSINADKKTGKTVEDQPSFTRTMWYAIRETKKIGWVSRGGAAPKTSKWDEWLREAEKNVENRGWNAVAKKDEIVGETDSIQQLKVGDIRDTAEEHAPAVQIPPQLTK